MKRVSDIKKEIKAPHMYSTTGRRKEEELEKIPVKKKQISKKKK